MKRIKIRFVKPKSLIQKLYDIIDTRGLKICASGQR